MATAIDTGLAPGLWVAGEYLGAEKRPDRPDGHGGTYAGKFVVSLLVGKRVVDVEYRDEQAAEAAMPGAVARGDLITLGIGVRAAKGYTFYFGRSGSQSGE